VPNGIQRRANLVIEVGEEARLELVDPLEVDGALVELRVQRQHATIRLRELLREPVGFDLLLAEVGERAGELMTLRLHLEQRIETGGSDDRANGGADRAGGGA